VQAVVRESGGRLLLAGGFPIHDLPDIGVDMPPGVDEGDYTTVAGLVLARLGHIPTVPGETVRLPGFTAEVVEVTGRAITKVRLHPDADREAGTRESLPAGDQANPSR
jgi:putative hemolysin